MEDIHHVSGADPGILKGGGGGGGGGGPAEFSSKRGSPTTYSGAICIANKTKSSQKKRGGGGGGGGSGSPGHPPGSTPVVWIPQTCMVRNDAVRHEEHLCNQIPCRYHMLECTRCCASAGTAVSLAVASDDLQQMFRSRR